MPDVPDPLASDPHVSDPCGDGPGGAVPSQTAPGIADPGGTTDSAGRPWAGRTFQPNAHADDDGSADPALAAALAAFHAERGTAAAVVAAFGAARVLVPIVTALGEGGPEPGPFGFMVDKRQELSLVTVAGPDGAPTLPAFTSAATLAAWNPQARPIPVPGVRVALAAAAEQTDRVVLDAAAPTSFVMRRPAIWACAQGQTWTEPWASQELQAAFDASTATELAVLSARPQAADPQATGIGPEVRVIVELVAGLRGPELDVILRRLAARWAADERIAFGVDSIAVELRGVSG